MNNCLVEQGVSAISGNNPILGGIVFRIVTTSAIGNFYIKSSKNYTIKIIDGNGYLCDSSGNNPTLEDNYEASGTGSKTWYTTANSDVTILVTNKYGIINFGTDDTTTKLKDFDVSQFAYTQLSLFHYGYPISLAGSISDWGSLKDTLSEVQGRANAVGIEGDISVFSDFTALTKLMLSGSQITGNIESLKNKTTITLIGFDNCYDVYGDIKHLGTLINLSATEMYMQSTQIYGNIEEFAEAMISNGKTSGQIKFALKGAKVKYDGNLITQVHTTITFDTSLPNGYSVALV